MKILSKHFYYQFIILSRQRIYAVYLKLRNDDCIIIAVIYLATTSRETQETRMMPREQHEEST